MSIINASSTLTFSQVKSQRDAHHLRYDLPSDFYAQIEDSFALRMQNARERLHLQWTLADDVIQHMRNAQRNSITTGPCRDLASNYDDLLEATDVWVFHAAILLANADHLKMLLPTVRTQILRASGFQSADELNPAVVASGIVSYARTSLLVAGHLGGLMDEKSVTDIQGRYPFLMHDLQKFVAQYGFSLDVQALCTPVVPTKPKSKNNVLRLVR